jgi:hypothetical protein
VLAGVEVERGDHTSAARLLGTSEALRRALQYEAQPAERALREDTLSKIRSAIGEAASTHAWSEGADLDVEETLALCTLSGSRKAT